MDENIKRILEDLYAVDGSLRAREGDLIKLVGEMLKAKPDSRLDEKFARKLRAEILTRARGAKPAEFLLPRPVGFFQFGGGSLFRKFVYAAGGVVVLILVALPVAYRYRGANPFPFNPPSVLGGKLDDWKYDPGAGTDGGNSGWLGVYKSAVPGGSSFSAPSNKQMNDENLGLSVGGAKDINNFRQNIENNYLPLSTDITHEGLFYDYYFDTGQTGKCDSLFCPSYSYAVSPDPLSRKNDYYLSVGLNSGLKESDFQRKKLNLVVVLDISGSMGSPFDKYYYDKFGANAITVKGAAGGTSADDWQASKIEIATKSVAALLGHLKPDDRFGMVLFDDSAYLAKPLDIVGDTDMARIKSHVLEIKARGGTQMSAGMKMGTDLFGELKSVDRSQYENRIIFLTDAMPNLGQTSENDLLGLLKKNADDKIYTTFIGIGVDFNTELVDYITKVRGANYYSVHSSSEFADRLDSEFDYMVTPLVFNLEMDLAARGYAIEKVYGSPEADEATGRLLKVNTLFPSSTRGGETKGGIILLKLKKLAPDADLKLRVSYEDRSGKTFTSEAKVEMAGDQEFYANSGVRKGILLSRYVDLVKNWINDERRYHGGPALFKPAVDEATGIMVPPANIPLGQWERQSLPLEVSGQYKELFSRFEKYFKKETVSLGDNTLDREITVLEKLSSH